MNTRFSAPAPPWLMLFAAAFTLAAALPAEAAEPAGDAPKPAWRSGPVRYLLTPEEDKAYKALKTDEERTKAIEEFWSKRDPSPGTPANEFREDFMRRVEETGKQFREGTLPGWQTDRGRILLTAGVPADRVSETASDTWTYTRGGKTYKIVFSKAEGEEEFRMNSVGRDLLNELGKLEPAQLAAQSLPAGAIAAAGGGAPTKSAAPAAAPGGGADAAPGADAAAAALPPEIVRLREAALASEPKADIAVSTASRFFKAEDGSTRTVVVIAVKKADVTAGSNGKPPLLMYARLTPDDAPGTQVEFFDQELFSFQDDAGEGYYKYAFAWPLKRKSYQLRLAVSDGPEGKIGTASQALSLPDFRGESLVLSSITLASSVSPAAGTAEEDSFRVGSLRLVPWVKPTLRAKDDLNFFYDVYNAKPDPASGKPALDVTYVFEQKIQSAWKPRGRLAEPGKHEETLGYTIPSDALSKWPAGEFRLTVQVKDTIAGSQTSATTEFAIVK